MVPGDTVARGILLVGIAGTTGATYQLAGATIPSAMSLQHLFRAIGEEAPSVRHFTTSELDRLISLLNGDSYVRTARDAVDYSRRAFANLGLVGLNLLTLGALALPAAVTIGGDLLTGSLRAVRNGFDNSEAMVLRAIGMKSWQVALLRQMRHRSASKVRALNRLIRDPRFVHLHYPAESEIRSRLPEAFARQAAWLKTRGLLD
jgi:hypothetical protein